MTAPETLATADFAEEVKIHSLIALRKVFAEMDADGRIVFVASEGGTWGFIEQPDEIKERVLSASRDDLTEMAASYVAASQAGDRSAGLELPLQPQRHRVSELDGTHAKERA